jgi:hypothetical protein
MVGDIGRLYHELLILQYANANVPESACGDSMNSNSKRSSKQTQIQTRTVVPTQSQISTQPAENYGLGNERSIAF